MAGFSGPQPALQNVEGAWSGHPCPRALGEATCPEAQWVVMCGHVIQAGPMSTGPGMFAGTTGNRFSISLGRIDLAGLKVKSIRAPLGTSRRGV